MSWSPDSDPSGGGWSPEPDPERGGAPAELVLLTNVAFRLRITPVPHERAGPGEQAFATYLADVDPGAEDPRPVAVGALPEEAVTALLASDLFAEPAPLMLRASEGDDGQVRGVVSALLPQPLLERFARRLASESEPWAASVPAEPDPIAGAGDEDEEEGDSLVPFALGVLLRFAENRKHRDDLAAEAADLFMTVLRGGAMDADAKKIDNLISGL